MFNAMHKTTSITAGR